MNIDRHMRNFGVIRSSVTGKPLRLAPNFDNNQACTSDPRGVYGDRIPKACLADAGQDLYAELAVLTEAARNSGFLQSTIEAAERLL